jgi:parvulin-like peptidyl-prolyl isomerase
MKVGPIVLAATLGGILGCGAVATAPGWTGGGLRVTGPRRALEAPIETTEPPRTGAPAGAEEVSARHILVMHTGSKARPPGVTRSREEARARAQECLVKLRAGGDFSELAREFSDDPGTLDRGGDLGSFRRESMVEAFSKAAFALQVGEVSEVVETPYGFHIIKRTQ